MEEKDITVEQAANFLGVPEKTILRWVRQGVIPTYRAGDQQMFRKEELEGWAQHKRLGQFQASTGPIRDESEQVDLLIALERGGIHFDLEGDSREEVYRAALSRLDFRGENSGTLRENLLSSLLARESLASTGIGKGIAIPHPRQPGDWGLDQPMAAVYFLKKPLEFDSIDGEPVFVLFLTLCSTVKGHLRMLAQISLLLHNATMQEMIRSMPDPKSLMEFIEKFVSGT